MAKPDSSTTEAESTSASDLSGGDTAVRPGLADQLRAKLASTRSRDDSNGSSEADPSGFGGTKPSQLKRDPKQQAAPGTQSKPRKTRRARLRLTRIDPWSVMKTSFLLSIAFGIVLVVAVGMIWSVLSAAGVWDSINEAVQESIGGPDTADLDVEDYVGTSRVLGFTMLIAAVDVVLITAMATLSAFLYNMSAALLGGIEVTLAEDPK